jgi:hypothetical protein
MIVATLFFYFPNKTKQNKTKQTNKQLDYETV